MKLEWLSQLTDAELVEALGTPHLARAASHELQKRGRDAARAVLAGLADARAAVRLHCCRLMDRIYLPEDFPTLMRMLDDPHPAVRSSVLHTLSCDRCKADEAPPIEGPLLDRAILAVAADPDRHVRMMALEAVGRAVHVSRRASEAIALAASSDPSAPVRKKARWFAPGGPVHRRTAPRLARRAG